MKIALAVVGIAGLLSLMVIAFALPAVKSGFHQIPLGVVATPEQAQQLQNAADGFTITLFTDGDAARKAIADRKVYGALVFGDHQVTILTATAASPAVAALIPTLGKKIAAASGLPVRTDELRAFPAADPKGTGLAVGALPLALGGWISAMVIMLIVPSAQGRLIATAAVAVVSGAALVATLQFVIGTFDGDYWLTTLAGMLGIGATCCAVLGLREFFGAAGLGIAAVLLIFLGNPLSGLSSAPEMLPRPWGTIGQLLPPGATGTLLRDVAFFDGHGSGNALVVLACWLCGGLGLYLAGVRRNARTVQVDVDEVHIGHQPLNSPAPGHAPRPPVNPDMSARTVAFAHPSTPEARGPNRPALPDLTPWVRPGGNSPVQISYEASTPPPTDGRRPPQQPPVAPQPQRYPLEHPNRRQRSAHDATSPLHRPPPNESPPPHPWQGDAR